MTQEKTQRLADLAERFSEALRTDVICADEIRAIVQAELDNHTVVGWGRLQDAKHRNPPPQRPLVDSSTFSLFWAGKTCPLRRTILFRLCVLNKVPQKDATVVRDTFDHHLGTLAKPPGQA